MNQTKTEDKIILKVTINLEIARNARDAKPECMKTLDEYIQANVEYYSVSEEAVSAIGKE